MELSSKYNPLDQVTVNFGSAGSLQNCVVSKVSFTESKVFYTVAVLELIDDELEVIQILENIDSVFISESE